MNPSPLAVANVRSRESCKKPNISVKRWVLKLAVCLLAGAMVTWLTAWGCAWTVNPQWRTGADEDNPGEWPRGAPPNWRSPLIRRVIETAVRTRHFWYSQDRCLAAEVEDFGWPCRSMRALKIVDPPGAWNVYRFARWVVRAFCRGRH